MAMLPKAFQNPEEVLDGLMLLLFCAGCAYVAACGVGAMTRARRRPEPAGGTTYEPFVGTSAAPGRAALRALSTVGFLVTIASNASAHRRLAVPPSGGAAAPAPPWTSTSGFPPPRPLVGSTPRADGPTATRGPEDRAGRAPRRGDTGPADPGTAAAPVRGAADAGGHHDEGDDARRSHPALHPLAGTDVVTPLFPRAFRYGARRDAERAARQRSIESHPAGKTPGCLDPRGRYTVVHGDTLWDIAARLLGSSDAGRIARYWPSIHRANRDVIGPDPSLIIPGTVLRLPRECRG